ncbi:MAG: fibrobacter succinogenes major paralogous domain-containing protein [Prevotella sp.]|nr:fibrobacter succinogenes major paralogous domain-containing protein [Prevotella sp.]
MFGDYSVRRYIQSRGCFFPAAGYRNYDYGGLREVGYAAHHWSSSPSNSDAYRLCIFGGNVDAPSAITRTYGFPVRCVKEFILVFM